MIKEQVAFLFGYEDFSVVSIPPLGSETVAEQSSQKIQVLLLAALQKYLDLPQHLQDEIAVVTSTQTSLARSRNRVLSQESGCSAAGDVLVVAVNVPNTMTVEQWKQVFDNMKLQLAAETRKNDNDKQL
ncbi:MAG: hypothetical protein SGARI_006069, partial [Bacillariaceae sp.]